MDRHTESFPPASTETHPIEPHLPETAVQRRPGIWSGLGTVALYFLLQFGLSIAIGAVLGFALDLSARIEGGTRRGWPGLHAVLQNLQTRPDFRVVLAVLTIVAAAVVMIVVVRRLWPAQWSRAELPGFGFTPPENRLAYAGAVALALLVLMLGGPLTEWLAGSHPVQQNIDVMADQVSLGMRIPLALLVVCVAPVIEELVFRGVLLSGLARRMPVGWAILVSAVIFGCAHLPDFKFAWYPVPTLVLLGLALAWLRVRTRSLWPSITLHATNNFIAMLAWFIAAVPH